MVYTKVITMKVPITAYIMFIVFSSVVCPSDCGVTVDQKYVWYDIQNKSSIEVLQKSDSVNKTKDYQFYSRSSSNRQHNILTMIYMINRPIAHSGFYYKIMLFFMG